jgi:hypothetical protein
VVVDEGDEAIGEDGVLATGDAEVVFDVDSRFREVEGFEVVADGDALMEGLVGREAVVVMLLLPLVSRSTSMTVHLSSLKISQVPVGTPEAAAVNAGRVVQVSWERAQRTSSLDRNTTPAAKITLAYGVNWPVRIAGQRRQ